MTYSRALLTNYLAEHQKWYKIGEALLNSNTDRKTKSEVRKVLKVKEKIIADLKTSIKKLK